MDAKRMLGMLRQLNRRQEQGRPLQREQEERERRAREEAFKAQQCEQEEWERAREESARQERERQQREQQEVRERCAQERNECCVCMDAPVQARLVPCAHDCLCQACAQVIVGESRTCPLCRSATSGFILVSSRQ
jgi:hypothetical protein